jgi:hypothetical protein
VLEQIALELLVSQNMFLRVLKTFELSSVLEQGALESLNSQNISPRVLQTFELTSVLKHGALEPLDSQNISLRHLLKTTELSSVLKQGAPESRSVKTLISHSGQTLETFVKHGMTKLWAAVAARARHDMKTPNELFPPFVPPLIPPPFPPPLPPFCLCLQL